jgi:D-glycero-alpha-D-manno-heptose-7-phosphate kinase
VTGRFEPGIRVSYSVTEIVDSVEELDHELLREALRSAEIGSKVEIVTIADVPSRGTGLGSSSAVTVGALNALFASRGVRKPPEDLAAEASRIEIEVLGKPIGRQDQYACAFGGLQFLRFGADGEVEREPVAVDESTLAALEANLLVFYTGRQRAAGDMLAPLARQLDSNAGTRDALTAMRDLAVGLREELEGGGSADIVGHYLDRSWQLKRGLTPTSSDGQIDRWYGDAREAGAIGGKLLGAGGGGFLLFYVPDGRHDDVRRALSDLQELPIRFHAEGSTIMRVAG